MKKVKLENNSAKYIQYGINALCIFIILFIIGLCTRTIVISVGDSMQPSSGNLGISVCNPFYKEINRFDVVVTDYKLKRTNETQKLTDRGLLKRIVGLPGETIEIVDDQLYINGQLTEHPYIEWSKMYDAPVRLTLGNDEYFVMGDNNYASEDSFSTGKPINKKYIACIVNEKYSFSMNIGK